MQLPGRWVPARDHLTTSEPLPVVRGAYTGMVTYTEPKSGFSVRWQRARPGSQRDDRLDQSANTMLVAGSNASWGRRNTMAGACGEWVVRRSDGRVEVLRFENGERVDR